MCAFEWVFIWRRVVFVFFSIIVRCNWSKFYCMSTTTVYFFYQFYLQGAKFFSSVEFFLLMFLIKGPKLLGMSQSKSTTNANTKKKYITKSVSWSLIKLFLFTTRTKNLQGLHAPWKFLNFKIKIWGPLKVLLNCIQCWKVLDFQCQLYPTQQTQKDLQDKLLLLWKN